MIYVNQKQLDQVEYILQQSALGHHILFDNEELRRIFHSGILTRSSSTPPKRKETKVGDQPTEAEKHIENLILQPTILSKKTYLENLTPQMYEQVVITYFSIVENNIFEGMEYSH